MAQSAFARIASEVKASLRRIITADDRDAEWHRVNSYIADVLKDSHVLYAKLARLQTDFAGTELNHLEEISESVLDLGKRLSQFSKDFYEGKYAMQSTETTYGAPQPGQGAPPAPPPPAPEGQFDVQAEETEEPGGQAQQGQGQAQQQSQQQSKPKSK